MWKPIAIIENTEQAQTDYGTAWGCHHELVTQEHIDALLAGKQLALYDGEYMTFLSMREPERQAVNHATEHS